MFWAELAPRSGSEQSGRRPVIVISHDGFNESIRWQSVIVVPISTSSSQARRGPTAVSLPPGTGGLKQESVGLCHQITTLDRSKLSQKIGEIDHATLNRIEAGIKAATGML